MAVREMLPRAEVYVYKGKRGGAGVEQSGSEREEILGFIGLNGEYIEGIFVSHEAQSCGIGKALMDHVKERKQKLLLSVYKKNRRALNFYRRETFASVRRKQTGTLGAGVPSGLGEKSENKDIKNPLYRSSFRTVDFQLITSMGLTSLFYFLSI